MRKILASTMLVGGVIGALALAPTALADDNPSDNKTCEDLGLETYKKVDIEGDANGDYSDENVMVDVSDDLLTVDVVPAEGFDIAAVLVKGGAEPSDGGTAIYETPPFIDLTAPGGHAISHWSICVGPTDEPTDEPTEEPTDEPTEEPTDEPTAKPTASETPTPTAVPTAPPGEELPDTGSNTSMLGMIAAVGLAAGGGMLFWSRRQTS